MISQVFRGAASRPIVRQLTSFVGVGVLATVLHYVTLVALVQFVGVPPVPAALCGFLIGAVLSYTLNRRHTFGSERPHEEAIWRFGLVAGVAFALTYLFMRAMVEGQISGQRAKPKKMP